jgi:lipoprotein-anchoring transpeptidase ErfK/SrfK
LLCGETRKKCIKFELKFLKDQKMSVKFRKIQAGKLIVLVFAFSIILVSSGCLPPENAANTSVNTNANAVNSAPANSVADPTLSKERASRMPVTLPVLDAMFSDENFANELKSELQLTDEHIQNLKNLSRTAVLNLNESETDEYDGSTRAAIERADKQIRETIGDEKTVRLFEIIRQRWSNGNETANNFSSEPNSVPTDTRIVVNSPAYRMDVFQEGKLVKSYKIGIGYPEFPLPSGLRKADTIIFNPTWTPPDEPWVKGRLQPYKTVEAGSKDNPLGPIKIPIGLPSLIHGGKAPARLGGFASHGCVGLTNSQIQDFALELAKISGLSLTAEEIKNYEKQKTETKNVKLNQAIPVELRYETIVVEDGKLRIFRDVYERGTNTEENLRRVLQIYGVSLDNLPDREKILQGLKQMAYDATGNPVETNNADSNSNVNSNKKSSANSNSDDSKVTRSIKGKKEVSFDIAELKDKGYPAMLEDKK